MNYTKVKDTGSPPYRSKFVYLSDGTAFRIDVWFSTEGGHFEFYPNAKDINSSKRGVNCFMFGFWPAGSYKYHYNKGVEPYLANWNGNEDDFKNHSVYGCNSDAAQRQYCTVLIQRNGWRIPDDYPFKF